MEICSSPNSWAKAGGGLFGSRLARSQWLPRLSLQGWSPKSKSKIDLVDLKWRE